MNTAKLQLTAAQRAFLQGDVVIYAATADSHAIPHVARAAGCRVDTEQSTITIFLRASEAGTLLADLRTNPALAVVFCEPGTEKSIQLKARDAHIAPVRPDDRHLFADYCERLVAHTARLGFAEAMLQTFFAAPGSDAVALQFTPDAAFDQTPGPNAGAALGSAT